jgi:hypothetical protein
LRANDEGASLGKELEAVEEKRRKNMRLDHMSLNPVQEASASAPPVLASPSAPAAAGAAAAADTNPPRFRAPLVPLLPCVGILMNFYLVSTMSFMGLLLLFSFIGLCVLAYFPYAYSHAASRTGWSRVKESRAVRILLSTGEFREKQRWTRMRSNSI